jgi:hypothetical protein
MIEIPLPLEFHVLGTAVSLQGSAKGIASWKETIATAAATVLPETPWLLTDPLSVTIYVFPGSSMQGDIDNRIKPILDALVGKVYQDDAQIERIVIQRFEPGAMEYFDAPSRSLLAALEVEPPLVYIHLTDQIHEDLR